jgi:penicillin-binding protein 1A
VIILLTAAALTAGLPDISALDEVRRKPTITYLDRSGAVLGVRGGQYAPPVDIDRLPAYVPNAFVSIEDRRFYEHSGFDAIGIARALAADLAHGRIVEGASTITQQLARNLFLTPDQTMERKAQEVMLAVMIERRYTNKQILGLYLSRVYFGSGAYGLEAASRRYFDKPASKLTLAEAAVLAGVLKSPTNYNPLDHPDHASERARLVLDAMVETGSITPGQRRLALARPAQARRSAASTAAQYFVDWADTQTRQLIGPLREDLTVETTLDLPLESLAAKAAEEALARERGRRVQQTALVSLGPDGAVRALVGGSDYAESQFDRAVSARRQAGSAWKPFVYLAAMEAGRTPETPAVDGPVTIGAWSPRDFEPEYLGPITLKVALAHSVNTVAASLADEVGREAVVRVAHRLGIVSPINTDPAMALGTTLVTPLEMASAYVPFSNGGRRAPAYAVVSIRTAAGKPLYLHRSEAQAQVIDNPALGEMDDMLRGVITEGTGSRAAIPGLDLAGKTGTTSDFRDAWFCGFTGGLATVVWMGRDDNGPMQGVTGGSGPALLWKSYMSAAAARVRAGPIPAGPPAPVNAPPLLDATPALGRDPVTELLSGTASTPPAQPQPSAPPT